MTPVFQFRLVVSGVPDDDAIQAVLALDGSPAVEISHIEALGVVWFDRPAPDLATAIAGAALDLERLGLRPTRTEPRELVTIPEAAGRLGRPAERLRPRLMAGLNDPHAPTPHRTCPAGSEPMFVWDDIATWVRQHLDPALPDDTPVLNAGTTALRLRRHVLEGASVAPLVALADPTHVTRPAIPRAIRRPADNRRPHD